VRGNGDERGDLVSVGSAPVLVNDLGRALGEEREELLNAIGRVLDSGWLALGERVREFEAALAAACGAAHAVGVASGTDALELSLRATVPAGRDIVVTAANCGGYTSAAARRAGLNPQYADVDPVTHLLTPHTLAPVLRRLDGQVGAVVVTHLYGRAADAAAIAGLCRPLGIALIEDCAQAIGARVEGRPVGSVGDAAAFSFYPTKNLGALGDGGAVVTSSDTVAGAVTALRQYGWKDAKYVTALAGGCNSRLDEVHAAALLVRLPRVAAWNARRRQIVAAYRDAAGPGVRVLPAEGESHAAHLAVVEVAERAEVRQFLHSRGVRTDIHYPVPDHRQPAFAAEYADADLPVTERLAARVLSLPLFPQLRDEETDRICAALAEL
jgi:dTDP-4-amino-4,6-dideoxygalactose transaminase